MLLINCIVELKLKPRKHYVLAGVRNENINDNPDKIIYAIKDGILYVPVVTLLTKNNQKLLAKDLKEQCIGMNIKQKSENKKTTNEYKYFLESNCVGIKGSFWLIQIKIRI